MERPDETTPGGGLSAVPHPDAGGFDSPAPADDFGGFDEPGVDATATPDGFAPDDDDDQEPDADPAPEAEWSSDGPADDQTQAGRGPAGSFEDRHVQNAPPVTPEPEQPQMFPHGSLEGDADVTLATLVAPTVETSLVVKLSAAQVPSKDGQLLDPNEMVRLSLVGRPGKVVLQPEYAGEDDEITGWKQVQHVRVTYVESFEKRLKDERASGREEGRAELLKQLGMTETDVTARAA